VSEGVSAKADADAGVWVWTWGLAWVQVWNGSRFRWGRPALLRGPSLLFAHGHTDKHTYRSTGMKEFAFLHTIWAGLSVYLFIGWDADMKKGVWGCWSHQSQCEQIQDIFVYTYSCWSEMLRFLKSVIDKLGGEWNLGGKFSEFEVDLSSKLKSRDQILKSAVWETWGDPATGKMHYVIYLYTYIYIYI